MQQLEARKIREASDAFGAKVEKFRETFLAIAPTTVKGAKIATDDVAPAYEILDHFHHGVEDKTFVYGSLSTIAAQAKALNEKQELFELHVSEYIQLKRSAEDLEFLKMLWDTASSVIYTFDSWNITLWDKIDVEFLVDECKKLAKEIKMLPKGCRAVRLVQNPGGPGEGAAHVAAARVRAAPPVDARPALEAADEGHREALRDGRHVQLRGPARAGAAHVRRRRL